MRTISRSLVAALTAILLAGMPVSADHDVGTQGSVGRHVIVDELDQPGARCIYLDVDGDMVLDAISVRAPTVYARDRTAHRDRQIVDWRVQLVGWVPIPDAPWQSHLVLLDVGPLHEAIAWDDTRAPFSRDTLRIRDWARAYEVRVRITWRDPADLSHAAGSSRHAIDHYAVEGVDGSWSSCIVQVF